ncbi:MAG: SAM-dependent DNA methyltransferase, partial [Deltaproteobacteria bacterium]|nr:SAM-dependent DNA methyltransferase [Deltaproteobacteria bacterium]
MRTLPVAAPRRALGQFFTAAPVARLAIAAVAPVSAATRVLDPMCGDGAFLAAAQAAGITSLTGVEIDAVEAARAAQLHGAAITRGDALAPGLPARLGTFDLVIGNPPYVRAGHVDPDVRRARAAAIAEDWPELPRELIDRVARHADVAATCLLRALRFVRPGGSFALVVSTALLDADCAEALWSAVARIAEVRALIIAPAERWFADAAVNPMLVTGVARRNAPSSPRLLRLTAPTEVAAREPGLDAIARHADERRAEDAAHWGPA